MPLDGAMASQRPRVRLFFRRAHEGQFSIERVFNEVSAAFRQVDVERCVPPVHSKGLMNRLRLLAWARRNRGTINHVTGDISFIAVALPRRRTVLTIHDLGPFTGRPGLKRTVYSWIWIRIPVWRAAIVTVVSEETRRLILAETGCSPDKVKVIHNPLFPGFERSAKRFDTEHPRLLQIGTKFNKNLPRVIEALAGLPVTLVVVGRRTDEIRHAAEVHGVTIEHLVDLSDQEMVEQYRRCDIVLFASTMEGFGLPIIEGQSVGRPVVVSRIAPLTEVAGPDACFVDPTSVDSIRAGVIRLIQDPAYRRDIIAQGEVNARRFSLSSIAHQYEELYESLLE